MAVGHKRVNSRFLAIEKSMRGNKDCNSPLGKSTLKVRDDNVGIEIAPIKGDAVRVAGAMQSTQRKVLGGGRQNRPRREGEHRLASDQMEDESEKEGLT